MTTKATSVCLPNERRKVMIPFGLQRIKQNRAHIFLAAIEYPVVLNITEYCVKCILFEFAVDFIQC